MSQEIRTVLANNIEKLRTKMNLKREELSLLLGFDNSYISKLEKSRINITLDKLEKIAKYFDTDVYKLLKSIVSSTLIPAFILFAELYASYME